MRKATWALAILAGLFSLVLLVKPVFAAGIWIPGRDYVPGQLVVRVESGVDPAAVAAQLGMRVKRAIGLSNAYVFEADAQADITVLASRLRSQGGVVAAEPNVCFHLLAEPNDPGFQNGKQWALDSINATTAWDVEKGRFPVTVAVLDSGISPTHPDLKGRLLPGRDYVNSDNDPRDDNGHGTHVAGIIAATTDNGMGIAGVCWRGVRLLPLKIADAQRVVGGYDPLIPMSVVIEALSDAAQSGAQVVNMSFGGAIDPGLIFHQAIQTAAQTMILVAGAGNYDPTATSKPVFWPAAYQEVIAVSAIGPKAIGGGIWYDGIASYSAEGPEVAIAAPGGADDGVPAHDIYSTWWDATAGDTYGYDHGTSTASPHVAGACALLLSAGVPFKDVKTTLLKYARRPNIPDVDKTGFSKTQYGAGILDIGAALVNTSAGVELAYPSTDTTLVSYNRTPTIQGTLVLAQPATAKLIIDGVEIPSAEVTVTTYSTQAGTGYRLSYIPPHTPPFQGLDIGQHAIRIEASSPNGLRSATANLDVRQYFVPSGIRMMSIPYALYPEWSSPVDVFAQTGSSFSLYRYIDQLNRPYATFDALGLQEPEASFTPLDAGIDPVQLPRGVGYWVRVRDAQGAGLTICGKTYDQVAFQIPLRTGWNQIGDPFDYSVDWNSVLVQYNGETVSVGDASKNPRNWIRPTLYWYDGTTYQYANPPNGQLLPWGGDWVKALVPCTLIVPPLPSGSGFGVAQIGNQQ